MGVQVHSGTPSAGGAHVPNTRFDDTSGPMKKREGEEESYRRSEPQRPLVVVVAVAHARNGCDGVCGGWSVFSGCELPHSLLPAHWQRSTQSFAAENVMF